MSSMSELQELEQQKAQYALAIERWQRLERLRSQLEWKHLIEEGFLLQDCARYTHASVDTAIPKEQREDALKIAQAAGYLSKFLEVLETQGRYAQNRLPELDAAIEEARSAAV